MFDIRAIVAFNAAAIMLLTVVLLNSRKAIPRDVLDNKLFYLMIAVTMAQAVIETVSFLIVGVRFPGSYWCNVIINDLLYINNTSFAFLWVLYVDAKLFENEKRLKKRYAFVSIPALLIIITSLVNIFVPIFFSVDRITCEYTRSNLYFIPNLVIAFYLTYGFVLACKYKTQNKRYIFFPALIFLIPIATAAVAEFCFYGLNVLWIGAAISLTSIYINLQNQITYTDSLSGLYTRQYLTNYLQSEMKKSTGDKILSGIMLDIDKFKTINDTYGHLTGDEAIKQAGRILHNALDDNTLAFRFAGDEFILIQTVNNKKETLDKVELIRALSEQFNNSQGENAYHINFSIGCTVFDKDKDTFDTFLERMDNDMYAEKNQRYESGN